MLECHILGGLNLTLIFDGVLTRSGHGRCEGLGARTSNFDEIST